MMTDADHQSFTRADAVQAAELDRAQVLVDALGKRLASIESISGRKMALPVLNDPNWIVDMRRLVEEVETVQNEYHELCL